MAIERSLEIVDEKGNPVIILDSKGIQLFTPLQAGYANGVLNIDGTEVTPSNTSNYVDSYFHIKDYATPNAGFNNTTGFQNAINDINTAGGGTLIIDPGVWEIWSIVNLLHSGHYVSYKIQGTKGSVIKVKTGVEDYAFYVGNVNQLELRDLIFIGVPATTYDTGYLLQVGSTNKTKISSCQFFGLSAKHSLLYFLSGDVVIEDTQFFGNSGIDAVVFGNIGLANLTVRNTMFQDYGSLNTVYYSKVGANPAWIKVVTTVIPVSNFYGESVVMENVRFDEGAAASVSIQNTPHVLITNIGVNVSGTTNGCGVLLDNVAIAKIAFGYLGYTTNVRPAVKAINNTTVKTTSIIVTQGVIQSSVDGSSTVTEIA